MKKATKPQIQKIHILLNQLDIMDQKQEIIYSLTDKRTVSSRELTIDEAKRLITNLSQYDPADRLRKLIFSLAYQSEIIYGSSNEDKKMNAAKLNMFLRERGSVKKDLNKMNYTELVKTHRQFEAIVRNSNKSKDKKYADKIVHNLLEELNVLTL